MGPANGILVSQTLRDLVARGIITSPEPLGSDQIQPSSLDLRLGTRIWQLTCTFLPGRRGVRERLKTLALADHELHPDRPLALHRGGVYLAELAEGLVLPPGVWGRGNPKSSTGRLDVFVRLLTDDASSFDTVPDGYTGPLWLEITPQSFHVSVRAGDTLVQLRLGRGPALVDAAEVGRRRSELLLDGQRRQLPLLPERRPPTALDDASLLLSVDLEGDPGRPVGYLARRHMPPVDLRARGLPVERYWTPILAPADGLVLEPGEFYIFATWESLAIPPDLCAELVAFDATKGELRTHYAGFIDSGFGWSEDPAARGAKLVLEIRTHDVPFLLEHRQPLFRVELMRNEAHPDVLYGQTGSSYQMQGLKLAKQFG